MSKSTKKQEQLPPGVVPTIEQLAVALKVHRRSIGTWKHKPDFPQRSDGSYDVVEVDRWRHGYRFYSDGNVNVSSLLDDADHRAEHLVKCLKDIQPKLVESLPESQQPAFAALLDKTISEAIQDAYNGDSAFMYEDIYLNYEGGETEEKDE